MVHHPTAPPENVNGNSGASSAPPVEWWRVKEREEDAPRERSERGRGSILAPQGRQSRTRSAASLAGCRCRSPWCESSACRRRAFKSWAERLRAWEWHETRQLVLTVEREGWTNPAEAFEHYRGQVSRVMHEIRRHYVRLGVELLDIVSVLEWHKDGFPHWHVLERVSDGGRVSMIPLEVVHRVWGAARVLASRVESAVHWRELVGYVGAGGYFGAKDKRHQVSLPAWARGLPAGSIRKFNGAHLGSGVEGVREPNRAAVRARRTYAEVQENCGSESRLLFIGGAEVVRLPKLVVMRVLATFKDVEIWQRLDRPTTWIVSWEGASAWSMARRIERAFAALPDSERADLEYCCCAPWQRSISSAGASHAA